MGRKVEVETFTDEDIDAPVDLIAVLAEDLLALQAEEEDEVKEAEKEEELDNSDEEAKEEEEENNSEEGNDFLEFFNEEAERFCRDVEIGVILVGTVVREATGSESYKRGMIISNLPDRDYYYFRVGDVMSTVNLELLYGDFVRFTRSEIDGEKYATNVFLLRRNFAFGVITDIVPDDRVFVEIIGLRGEVSIPVRELDFFYERFQRGDEIACEIRFRGFPSHVTILNVQRLNANELQPDRILVQSVDGVICKSLSRSNDRFNSDYFGMIVILEKELKVISYGLFSQRDRSENFNTGDHVQFKIVSFFQGDWTAYDMIRRAP